jgi:hypothetical protein
MAALSAISDGTPLLFLAIVGEYVARIRGEFHGRSPVLGRARVLIHGIN